jgi:hypothetical protein
MSALAAAASVAIASPALAVPDVTDTNGSPLSQQIYGIAGTGPIVYGSSPNNDGVANVTFTGNTDIHVGSGFAQINDPTPDTTPWYSLEIDPLADFTDFKFSTMLEDPNGTISVFALLSGASDFVFVESYSAGINNLNKLLTGGTFDAFRIESTAPIAFFEVKQMSFNAAPGPIPEPGTWAMMLLGFGGIGFAMRRKNRNAGALAQVA